MVAAIISSVFAWFVGLMIDVNINSDPTAFLELRILLPIITMGGFILYNQRNKK